MKLQNLFLALFLVCFFANHVRAEEIVFDKDFPQPSPNKGGIRVQCTIKLDAGWSFVGKTVNLRIWPKNGGKLSGSSSLKLDIDPCDPTKGTVGPVDYYQLVAGAEYNVTVDVDIKSGTKKATLVTKIGVTKASN